MHWTAFGKALRQNCALQTAGAVSGKGHEFWLAASDKHVNFPTASGKKNTSNGMRSGIAMMSDCQTIGAGSLEAFEERIQTAAAACRFVAERYFQKPPGVRARGGLEVARASSAALPLFPCSTLIFGEMCIHIYIYRVFRIVPCGFRAGVYYLENAGIRSKAPVGMWRG